MKRDITIDLIKGGLIVLVVLGHSLQFGFGPEYRYSELFYDDYLFRAIYTFHMPLFMYISGFLYYHSDLKSYRKVLSSRIKSIGIPFISYFFIIYTLIFYFANAQSFYLMDFFNKMRINMWFLSSLLLNCMIVSSITHFLKTKVCVILGLGAVFIILHIISDATIPSHHKFMYFYFILGYCYSKQFGTILFFNSKILLIVLTLLFVLSLFVYDKTMFVYGSGICVLSDNQLVITQLFKDVVRYAIGIIDGLWFCCICSVMKNTSFFAKINFLLVSLGKYTLGIYGFQSVFFIILTEYMERYGVGIPHNYLTPVIMTLFVILLSVCFIKICDKTKITRGLFIGR